MKKRKAKPPRIVLSKKEWKRQERARLKKSPLARPKFIHHDSISAKLAPEDGWHGRWDVIEDGDGVYVFDQAAGMIIVRCKTVREATAIAKRKAKEFDAKANKVITDAVNAAEPIGAVMPDGSPLDQWDERLRAVGGAPVYGSKSAMTLQQYDWLSVYVSGDDVALDKISFLKTVAGRIADDVATFDKLPKLRRSKP